MKIGIEETKYSYIIHLMGPNLNLVRAVTKSRVHKSTDPRAYLANELELLFGEWEITEAISTEAKNRLVREFFE